MKKLYYIIVVVLLVNVAGYAAKSNSSDEKDPVPLREIKEYDESEKPRRVLLDMSGLSMTIKGMILDILYPVAQM